MSKGSRDNNLAQDDDFLDDSNDWNEPLAEHIPQDRYKSVPRSGPKWKAIEDYWEEKRLRDALQDYLGEEEE